MYCKYMLFYESPKNGGYFAHAQTVCTRPLLGEGPGNEASVHVGKNYCICQDKCIQVAGLICIVS